MVPSGNQICSRVNACYKIVAVGKQVCWYMSKTHMCTDGSQKAERWKPTEKTKKKRTFRKIGWKSVQLSSPVFFFFIHYTCHAILLYWFLLLTVKTCSSSALGTLNIIKYIPNNISVNYPCVQTHSSSV